MKNIIKKILKEELDLISYDQEMESPLPTEEDSLPTVVLVGGLDTGKFKNITLQKSLLQKGLGSGFKVIAHRWTEKEDAKITISQYPNSYLVLFSKGCEFSNEFASTLEKNGGYLSKMYIVEGYSCSSGTKKSIDSAISKGVPKRNVLGGNSDCTGKNVAGTFTNCTSKGGESHWCALTEVGEIISKK